MVCQSSKEVERDDKHACEFVKVVLLWSLHYFTHSKESHAKDGRVPPKNQYMPYPLA
jgi:hypothetical protein